MQIILDFNYLPAFLYTQEIYNVHAKYSRFDENYQHFHNTYWWYLDKERAKMIGMLNEIE